MNTEIRFRTSVEDKLTLQELANEHRVSLGGYIRMKLLAKN